MDSMIIPEYLRRKPSTKQAFLSDYEIAISRSTSYPSDPVPFTFENTKTESAHAESTKHLVYGNKKIENVVYKDQNLEPVTCKDGLSNSITCNNSPAKSATCKESPTEPIICKELPTEPNTSTNCSDSLGELILTSVDIPIKPVAVTLEKLPKSVLTCEDSLSQQALVQDDIPKEQLLTSQGLSTESEFANHCNENPAAYDDASLYSEMDDSDNDSDFVPLTDDNDSDQFPGPVLVVPSKKRKETMNTESCVLPGGSSASHETENTVELDEDRSYKRKIRHMYRNITVAGYEKKNNKRNYSKSDFCYFCKNSFCSKISKHILAIHFNEPAVKEIISKEIGSNERKLLLLKIQNEGNYMHNVKVLQDGCGELVVKRRPDQKNSSFAEDYVPCEFCLAFVKDNTLWIHAKNCAFRTMCEDKNYLRNGRAMLHTFLKDTDKSSELSDLFEQMKETLKNPGLKHICENDVLIREFATCLLEKLGTNEEQRRKDKDNIRTKVRTVARCLKRLNQDKFRELSLSNFICGEEFNNVVSAVKDLSVECDSPNLALTLGHYLKQICLLKKSLAIQNSDDRMKQDANNFRELYDAHWNSKVSAVSHRRLRLRKINKKIVIPCTDDLVKLKEFLCSEIKKRRNLKPSNEEWVKFAELLITRIVLFNKRRISEVEELKMSDFRNRLSGANIGEEIHMLETSERVLASRMDLVEVRGKSTRGLRKVFILLEPDMVNGIEYLLMTRIHAGINPRNKYVFGRTSLNPLDGCTAMRNVVKLCTGLKKPESIRSTLLRRYLATASQLLDMTGDELKMVADHMGHSVAIHTDVYRMQTSTIERTKVARALIALENGKLEKFKGKNLSSVQIEEIPIPVGRNEIDQDEAYNSGSEIIEGCCFDDQSKLVADDIIDSTVEDKVDMGSCTSKDAVSTGTQLTRMKKNRTTWTREENSVLQLHFSSYLKKETSTIRHRDIQDVVAKNQCLNRRTVPQIRAKLNNMRLGKCKM